MLTLLAEQPECLWDDALPVEVKELPADLAALDVLLSDHELLWPLVERWQQELRETGRLVLTEGRPTIALETYVRLMVLKARYRWGYRTLVAEVSDSIHLRRFCRISLLGAGAGRVDGAQAHAPDRRGDGGGADARVDRQGDAGEAVSAAGGADRLDGDRGRHQVSDRRGAGLARRAGAGPGGSQAGQSWSGRSARGCGIARGRWARSCARSRARSAAAPGEAKAEVLTLTKETGELLERSITEARRLAAVARRRARGRGARAKLAAARQLEELADRCEKVARQIRQRVAGEKITDRIVSLSDPDARPIRKGKIGKPTEFGYVSQLAEVTENTKPGARGLILPASHQIGNPSENTLLAREPSRSSPGWGSRHGRSRSTAGSSPPRRTPRSPSSAPRQCSSLATRSPPPDTPSAAWRATEPAPRAASVTSNAATGWTAAASKATKASRSGLSGRSSPTTPTRSPSGSGETLRIAPSTRANPFTTNGRARSLRGRFVGAAASSGGFDRSDAVVARRELILDERGFAQLASEVNALLERVKKIERESAQRLEATPGHSESGSRRG